ncbi:UNVERIFIED_CONTAM: Retrovirus-related Pol polyprotein from transposon RE1 [Sesamum radiatum]|uniref:Retrovirus-related Pol polyprotein from transposon RE1 n=1 Tax=Sesamum radiatum TaxID=300843 RepID=A0AAW2UAI8_SESRA
MEEIEENQLMQFLMGLSEPYDSIRSQILVLDPLPSVNKAYSMVLRVERQRRVNLEYADTGENHAMNIKNMEYKLNTGNKTFQKRRFVMDKKQMICEHCTKPGHSKESCFKLHGVPEWYKDLNEQKKWGMVTNRVYAATDAHISEDNKNTQRAEVVSVSELLEALKLVQTKAPQDPVKVHFAYDTEMTGITMQKKTGRISSGKWIVDSGATNHMCGDACAFHSISTLLNPTKVHLPDNSISYATHTGNIILSPTLTLTNVLLVPKHNLLSVSQLCQSFSAAFVFLTSSCVLQDLTTKQPLAVGTRVGKLYILDTNSFPTSTSLQPVCHSAEDTSANIEKYVMWHKRLGHPSSVVLTHIGVLNIDTLNKDHVCSICPLAKQSRKRFPISVSCTKNPFDLIHVDIWGPYKQSSLSGCHYILTIVDDYTRTTWTFLMVHKSQTTQLLSQFFSKTYTQFHTKVKIIRTDNGQKAYKLFNLDNNTVIISRDVTFHEHIFPYIGHSKPDTAPILVPTSILDQHTDSTSSAPSSLSFSDPDPPISSTPPPLPTQIPTVADLPRRSQRQVKPPSWLNDFHCNLSTDSFIHPSTLALSHSDFLAALSTIQEPSTYSQAKGCKEWEDAMSQELQELHALEKNNTWEMVPLPKDKKAIGCKWVYKVKLKADGSIDRYKARLVAKGYNQVEGVDYVDRFSPVAKAVTVRTFLAVATGFGWPIHQVDINNAFLHGFLEEDIYMKAPDGYHVQPGHVCKLKRSLYGLKQASRQWNLELTSHLISYGFVQSSYDHCLFTKQTVEGVIALIVYVNYVLITCSCEDRIHDVKRFLDGAFTIKDLGLAKYFLGLEIARSTTGTSITQHKFIRDIISDVGLQSAKPASSPLPAGLKLSSHTSAPLSNPEQFRRLVGRLLYLSFTRPDISFGAQQLSQFVHAPCQVHLDAALHLVRYLKGCPERGLFFPASNSFTLAGYCDADWASCADTRRSLTVPTPIPLYCDNQAAIHIVANPVFHERTKHIEIDCHLVRDKFKSGFVLPQHIPGTEQLADVLTKSLSGFQFSNLLSKMGLKSFPQVHLEGGMKRFSSAAAAAATIRDAATTIRAIRAQGDSNPETNTMQ